MVDKEGPLRSKGTCPKGDYAQKAPEQYFYEFSAFRSKPKKWVLLDWPKMAEMGIRAVLFEHNGPSDRSLF
jgi:hypothetical protein